MAKFGVGQPLEEVRCAHAAAIRGLGVEHVLLSGGEALLHSNLWRLCEWLREMSVHVSPPSVDFHSPESGPPLVMLHGVRRACHTAANMVRGLCGSSERSTAPAFSLLNRT